MWLKIVCNTILDMYITMLPVIFAGAFNMLFTKTRLYQKTNAPIDRNRIFIDGQRIFGDNKTWAGFVSMIIICMIVQCLWGAFCNLIHITYRNELYADYDNEVWFNLIAGFLFGLAYMAFELPNSFIKRRLKIVPGKTSKGIKGGIFFVVDQIDSLIGVILVLFCFSHMSIYKYCFYIFLGAFTHILVNLVLYKLHIRRNL